LPILLGAGLGVRRLVLPAGEDPDSVRLAAGPEELARRIAAAPDAIDREIDRIAPGGIRRSPREQAERAGEVAALLVAVRDPVARHGWAKGAAERLGIPIDLVLERARRLERATAAGSTKAGSRPEPEAPRRREPGLEHRLVEHLVATLPASGAPALAPAVAPAALPPEEAFGDGGCRLVVATWKALAAEGRLDRDQLVATLADQPEALDEIARILLGDPQPLAAKDFDQTVTALRDRHLKTVRVERQRELAAALEAGDQARADEILSQISQLQRELHPRSGASRLS
jgi:DNA primase